MQYNPGGYATEPWVERLIGDQQVCTRQAMGLRTCPRCADWPALGYNGVNSCECTAGKRHVRSISGVVLGFAWQEAIDGEG